MRLSAGHHSVPVTPKARHAAAAVDRGPGVAPRLTIARVNPLDHAEAIKGLFLAHARPEFPDFFDRTYPDAVARGGTSWVGWDEPGRLCAHITHFPREFLFGRAPVRATLLGNLMVATEYRTFWPAVALARRVVHDLRADGTTDFAYADPNESALPVLRAAGFGVVGDLQRHVLPLTDGRLGVDQAVHLYHMLGQMRTTPLVGVERSAHDAGALVDHAPSGDELRLCPIRDPAVYRSRLAGYPSASDRWFTFHARGPEYLIVGKALVRGPDRSGTVVVCAWHCEPMTLLSSVLVTLARHLRHGGAAARLEIWVMQESQAANAVRRAGFLRRQERAPVLAQPLTDRGADVLAAVRDWQLLAVDLDR